MQHFGLTIDLADDPDLIAQYKAYHANPWPEPLQGLGDVGITDMKIFLLGQRVVQPAFRHALASFFVE